MLKSFLDGIRVLDCSQYLPGPFATRLLADMGADVVKVEPPGGDPARNLDPEGKDGAYPYYDMLNAGKTVVTVDLKGDDGHAVFERLVAGADVLMESFRPGVLDRLGFGEERLNALNPNLIHCALSGFGQTGPFRLASGHDVNYVSMTGGLSASGVAERPVIPFPPLADHAGAMQAVITILGALVGRGLHGGGAYLDVSLSESLLSWQDLGLSLPPPRGEGLLNGGCACYQIYRTADDRFVSVSPLEPKFWANFCNAVGRPEWIPRQYEPLPQTALIAEVADLMATRSRDDWDAVLIPADCCYQAVLDYAEVAEHPQIKARGLVVPRDKYIEVLFPAMVDGVGPEPRPPLRQAEAEDVAAAWSEARRSGAA